MTHNDRMISIEKAAALTEEIRRIDRRGVDLRQAAMRSLAELPRYDWSGVYRLEGGVLVLDSFVGAETDHTRIPVGVGVCGTAVAERRNVVVDDVRAATNYLACSTQTRSEIVVLIRDGDEILGQIDVDGHEVGAFDASDEAFLGEVAGILAERWRD